MENTLTNGLVVKLYKDKFIATVTMSKDAQGDISIPQIIEYETNKYLITKIEGYAFSQNDLITSVSIPSSVRAIEESAFYKCNQLKSLIFISDSENDSLLEEIGNFAFGDCVNLETISSIPSSVRRIGNSSFSSCKKIASITIETVSKNGYSSLLEEIGDSAFFNCENLESISIIPSTVRRIGESAFYKCSKLKTVNFGSSNESKESNLKDICKFAFADCTSLQKVSKIPASVYRIGESAFANCTSLKDLSFSSFESSLEEIGDESFYNCTSLESVTFFPSNARRMGKHSFCKCSNLKSFSFGPSSGSQSNSLEEIGDFCFCDCLSLEKVANVPVSLRRICPSSFYKCENLKLLTFGTGSDGQRLSSLEEIGDDAFYCCSRLELVIMIPASVRFIGNSSFFQCKNLKLVIFEPKDSQLETIGNRAFYECENLISFTMIPASVRRIGNGSFYGCKTLKSVTFASHHQTSIDHPRLVEIGSKAFSKCDSLESVSNVPATVRKIGKKCFSKCECLKELNFLINEGFSTLPMLEEVSNFTFEGCVSLENVFILPATVRRIGKAAFANCKKLKALKFEGVSTDSVKSCLDEIEDDACLNCVELESVQNVPLRLRKIGSKAFFNCLKLKSFAFDLNPDPSSLPLLSYLGDQAFSGCTSLESFKSTSKLPILIGNSCFANDEVLGAVVCHSISVSIASSCFNNCRILSFAYFPALKVLNVAEEAFNGVPDNFEVFVPLDTEINGTGLEKVRNRIRTNQEPKSNNDEKQ